MFPKFSVKLLRYTKILKGQEHSAGVKTIYFRVTDFIEKEKNGPMILLNLTTARILAVLGVSERSLFNLKSEMKQAQEEELIREKSIEVRHLRSRTTSDTAINSSSIVNRHRSRRFIPGSISQTSFASVSLTIAPKKFCNSGRPRLHLTDEEIDEICFTFHLLLSQKLYHTAQRLTDSILAIDPDLPIK